ncbi:DUF192 domain-containing protein [Haloarculaceae archaeon H-GB2-1]|nr:DUF192 domain-containing protein [Haloarculaceae archaeon H-GB1-1]MEA5409268.1 DUF192 domain-containing protein [Haloarculaceae archaeon H-GB2-1]
MRVVHEPDAGSRDVLATQGDLADTVLSQTRGLMFRRSIPDDYALVFRFDDADRRFVHMLFVPFPIDVLWLRDGDVTHCKTLPAWRGVGSGLADTLLELPAGAAADVAIGDRVRVEP